MISRGHYIAGTWHPGEGERFVARDPASGEIRWTGSAATTSEVDAAVQAAQAASSGWARLPLQDRIAPLHAFAEQLRQHHDELRDIICSETGKPRWESAGEVEAMIGKVAISIDAYARHCRETSIDLNGAAGITRFKPHGVVAVLGPFNFPGHLPNGHIVPALLAGNSVVFKPSEMAPATAEKTVELWERAGLPRGVINLVQGARDTGAALIGHAEIDGVFFTGSFVVGREINRALADHPGKIIALEMGGNNPLIVHGVRDLDAAAYLTVQSAYLSAGQRCSCARRLIVTGDAAQFIDRLIAMIGRIRIGVYTDIPEPFMGPVISPAAAEKLLAAQRELQSRGGQSLVTMRPMNERRTLLSPGLIDVTHATDRPDAEHFGPLLQLVRAADLRAAIDEANRTQFGLAAGILSDDRSAFEQFAATVRAGVINWNRPLTGASSKLPFGGIGCSGNHRPSGAAAAQYCSYPVASLQSDTLALPKILSPGIEQ